MTIEAKKRWLAAILVVFALWPLAHFFLAKRYGVYPWKLFGWAMYAVPRRYLTVAAEDTTRRTATAPIDLRTGPPELIYAHHAFVDRRWVYGELHAPDSLAAEVFAAWPDVEEIRLQVRTLHLDLQSSRYVTARSDYVYERPGEGASATDSLSTRGGTRDPTRPN